MEIIIEYKDWLQLKSRINHRKTIEKMENIPIKKEHIRVADNMIQELIEKIEEIN